MELIDWGKVLTVAVAGAVIVSGTWGLLALGAVLFRRRGRLVREKKQHTLKNQPVRRGHARLTTHVAEGSNGQPEPREGPLKAGES